jgi:hypothetical protein
MLERLGSLRPRTVLTGAVLTIVVATVLFLVWPMPAVEEIAGPILDTRFMASGTDAAGYLDALGAEGRRLYTVLAVGDLLWAILHGLTVAAVIAVGARRSSLGDRWALLAVAALAYLVLDVVENSSILAALAAHPDPQPVPAIVMDLVTSAKFVALGVAYLAVVVVLVAWARARGARAGG